MARLPMADGSCDMDHKLSSGVPSRYARYSVKTLGYQKNIFLKNFIPLKPKIQYSHSLLYEISTLDCHY